MKDSPVIFEKDGRMARIILNRPEVLNAIDDRLPKLLQDAVEKANADESVRVIVLSGAGKAFCAGYDLKGYVIDNCSSRMLNFSGTTEKHPEV